MLNWATLAHGKTYNKVPQVAHSGVHRRRSARQVPDKADGGSFSFMKLDTREVGRAAMAGLMFRREVEAAGALAQRDWAFRSFNVRPPPVTSRINWGINVADGDLFEEAEEEIEDGPCRFHIAEWYGRPFLELSDEERLELANFKAKGSMSKTDQNRLLELRAKNPLTPREDARLGKLEQDYLDLTATRKVCPFRTDSPFPLCTKAGGVCSIRLVEEVGGKVQPVAGERAPIRATCPYRFQEGNRVFQAIGKDLLGDPEPHQAGEVGFLESTGNLDSAPGQDVGRIDMVLVKTNAPEGHPLEWVAAEIQAVYFSGDEMPMEFKQLRENGGRLTMPAGKRRPDYRSSGPKRLMPQLQIKVPTLRRWGRKMVCIVDTPFYDSMGKMEEVEDVSNGDIVWYLVDFVAGDPGEPHQLSVGRKATVTLERAIEGLTGGNPVAKTVFERRITKKMDDA